jgi:hypothetical protein
VTLLPDLLRLGAGSAAAFVCLLMLRAGLHKVGHQNDFQGVLADYGLLPEATLRPAAIALPTLEILAAAALCLSESRAFGVALAGGLLLVYAAAMSAALWQGRTEIDCGCGGAPSPIGWVLVGRNLLLAAALAPAGLGVGDWRNLGEAGVGWAIPLVGFCCWIACEHAAANHHRMRSSRDSLNAALFGSGA